MNEKIRCGLIIVLLYGRLWVVCLFRLVLKNLCVEFIVLWVNDILFLYLVVYVVEFIVWVRILRFVFSFCEDCESVVGGCIEMYYGYYLYEDSFSYYN